MKQLLELNLPNGLRMHISKKEFMVALNEISKAELNKALAMGLDSLEEYIDGGYGEILYLINEDLFDRYRKIVWSSNIRYKRDQPSRIREKLQRITTAIKGSCL